MSEDKGKYDHLIGNQRAAKPKSERVTEPIHFRARAADKELWQNMADAEGISLAQWIKNRLPEAE